MKKILFCLLAVGFMTVCASAHAAGIQDYYAMKDTSFTEDFTDNIGKQWLLTNVSIDGEDSRFTRGELSGMFNEEEFFHIKFDSGNISGMGVPNRFSAPYTAGDNQTLKILPMRSTLMASLFEPKNLKEYDFFTYLHNAYKWQRKENKLEIYSKTEDQEVVLIFVDNYID